MSLKTDPDPVADGALDESPGQAADKDRADDPLSRRPVRRRSLAARLTAWYALSAFLLILLATVLLYLTLSSSVNSGYDLFLMDKINILSQILESDGVVHDELRQEIWEGAVSKQYARVAARILDGRGRVVMQSPRMAGTLPVKRFGPPIADYGERTPKGYTIYAANGAAYRAMAVQVAAPSGGPPWTIQVALSKLPQQQMLAGFRRMLTVLLILALGVCTAVGYEIARQGIRPIKMISAAARQVRSTNLSHRIDLPGLPAELSDLANSFNRMLDRLEGAFDRLNRFSADIAHELRTPVNNLRGQLEVSLSRERSPKVYQQTLDSCLEESVRLSRIIESLLFLARAEDPRAQLRAEPVELLQELQAAYDFYEAVASEGGITLKVVAPAGLWMDADHTLLQRAIGNLVGNAIRHTSEGGEIILSAEPMDGRRIRIQVADTGSGISPDHLPRVMDRFYRADPSRSSSGSQPGGHVGLGLAIVAGIAAMHDGHIDIQSEVGKGTRVTLDFPARAVQSG